MIYDLERIKNELEILPEWEDQICLQGTKIDKDPFAGIGKGKKIPGYELEFNYPLFDIPYINSIIEEKVKNSIRKEAYKGAMAEHNPVFVHFISKQLELAYK